MLLLLFQAGDQRFGMDVAPVVEVVPVPSLRALPHAPEWLAGFFAYRGTATPVIDLSSLLAGRPSRPLLSTRVIVVKYAVKDCAPRLLGIMAEQVVETVCCAPGQLQPPVATVKDAPYLGGLLLDDAGFVQTISVDRLLPESAHEMLFSREA